MEEWTFENADMSDAVMNRAKSYVENWNEMKRNHIGLLFWGPIGTGKSYVFRCIANDPFETGSNSQDDKFQYDY